MKLTGLAITFNIMLKINALIQDEKRLMIKYASMI